MKKLCLVILLSLLIGIGNCVTFTEKQLELLYTWPLLINWSKQQNELVQYAWDISKDFDFILTVFWESWFRPEAVWDNWYAFWLCQRNILHWRERLVNDEKFKDPKFQLDSCYNSYRIWIANGKIQNRLYAYNIRTKHTNRFRRSNMYQ